MNLPQAVVALLPPRGNNRKQVSWLCGEQKSTTNMRYRKVFSFKMVTMGIVGGCQEAATELGRNDEQDVSRKRGKQNGGVMKGEQMSGNSRPRPPSHPNRTRAAFPDLCTIKPTLLMTIWRNRRKRRSPTHSYL